MSKLASPRFYFPVSRNPFAFKTGLSKLDSTADDAVIFQIDKQWPEYHRQKQIARNENLEKYEEDLEQKLWAPDLDLELE